MLLLFVLFKNKCDIYCRWHYLGHGVQGPLCQLTKCYDKKSNMLKDGGVESAAIINKPLQ